MHYCHCWSELSLAAGVHEESDRPVLPNNQPSARCFRLLVNPDLILILTIALKISLNPQLALWVSGDQPVNGSGDFFSVFFQRPAATKQSNFPVIRVSNLLTVYFAAESNQWWRPQRNQRGKQGGNSTEQQGRLFCSSGFTNKTPLVTTFCYMFVSYKQIYVLFCCPKKSWHLQDLFTFYKKLMISFCLLRCKTFIIQF